MLQVFQLFQQVLLWILIGAITVKLIIGLQLRVIAMMHTAVVLVTIAQKCTGMIYPKNSVMRYVVSVISKMVI